MHAVPAAMPALDQVCPVQIADHPGGVGRRCAGARTFSITTSTTITASGPVPPHSRVNATLGVDAFNVLYSVACWQVDDNR